MATPTGERNESSSELPLVLPGLSSKVGGSPAPIGSGRILPYLAIARPDYWIKNVFMLLGALLATFYHPELFAFPLVLSLLVGLTATCLIASSNYILNEILDAARDAHHPVKRFRPIPTGLVRIPLAYIEYLFLGALGLSLAYWVGTSFFASGVILLVMGLAYNVPPIRTKELPYLDVLSEALNNPIRLMLGWFAISSREIPPITLLLAFWLAGAFFMAAKRLSEFRSIGNVRVAASYRSSFRYYDETRLLVSIFFYATSAALMIGIFIIRYKLELILTTPLFAAFFSYYLHIALKPGSAAQSPEHLYKERGLVLYLLFCVIISLFLLFSNIPVLYHWFNIAPSRLPTLWRI